MPTTVNAITNSRIGYAIGFFSSGIFSKFHAVDSRHECQRDEDAGHNGQDPHHFVLLITQCRKVGTQQRTGGFPERFQHVRHLRAVIMTISQETLSFHP